MVQGKICFYFRIYIFRDWSGNPHTTNKQGYYILFGKRWTSLGFVRYSDTGSAIYEGVPLSNAATTIGFYAKVASGTYISLATISGTVPHTWANTDLIEDWLDYELA